MQKKKTFCPPLRSLLAVLVILALLVKGLVMLLVRARLSRLKRANPELAAFSASVEIYQKNKQ